MKQEKYYISRAVLLIMLLLLKVVDVNIDIVVTQTKIASYS